MLPKAKREAMYTIYAFCRHIDDIVDGDSDMSEKQELLQAWREELDNIYDKKVPATEIGRRIYKNCMRFKLPKEEFMKLIDSISMDIPQPLQAPSLNEFYAYCRGVAGVPGNLSLRIFGCADEKIINDLATTLGNALQITNILRDVKEDAMSNRLYIPREFLQKANISSKDPRSVVVDKNLAVAREELAKLADADFKKADVLIQKLDKKTARPVKMIAAIYRKYFEHPIPENMPLLEDLYNALLTQDEPEARHVAAALEIYVKGSLNIFNHHTNVDINNRIVCFDIKQLGKQLKKLGMLIVQDAVWGRVTANRSAGKSTRYYADEFHLLLKEEQTAAYSVEIWKRFRKWGGIPTALTQNVKDLLASPEVSNIFENSDFVYMLNQANGDRQILAKQLNISPHQLSYVTHSGEGEGLLFFGNVILPFVDHFPKDLELYRILTTRLSEVAEAQKHE